MPASTGEESAAAPEITDDALVMAELMDLGAFLVEGPLAANRSSDPMGESVEVYREGAARAAALVPTPATAAITASHVEFAERMAALFEEYGPQLNDPVAAPSALPEFLAAITALGDEATDMDATLLSMIAGELLDRGDPHGPYLDELDSLTRQSQDAVVEMMGALELLAVDPRAGLDAMAGPFAEFSVMADGLEEMSVPPTAAELHGRQIDLLRTTADLFDELIASVERGEDPPLSVQISLQRVGQESPQWNADRSRFIAAVLRGEIG